MGIFRRVRIRPEIPSRTQRDVAGVIFDVRRVSPGGSGSSASCPPVPSRLAGPPGADTPPGVPHGGHPGLSLAEIIEDGSRVRIPVLPRDGTPEARSLEAQGRFQPLTTEELASIQAAVDTTWRTLVATADQSGNWNGEVGSRAATPESERH